jgi:alkanesulfonate monooxygenase SsuD/methylene tetrahydromethanopterin reductase-like flavin-dependent oxidoreductase (luciferase family)
MKFSIIYEAQTVDTSREAEFALFHQLIEQSLLAETLGFDCVWAVEHTALKQYAHMSAPETFLAFLAGKTTSLQVGHGVICLPPAMNHPVKVAQRVAMLDVLSKGRLHFGVGKGGSQQEAGTFGYELSTLAPMIDESMYLIPKILVQDEVEHAGKYINIPRRPINPKPYQQPHPPMYLACTRGDSLLTAGARGMGALCFGFGGPEDVAQKNSIYRQAFNDRRLEDQVGFRPNEHLAALCPAVVLEDRELARRIGLRGQRFFVESLAHWYNNGPPPGVDDLGADAQLSALGAVKRQFTAQLGDENIALPRDLAGYFEEVKDSYGTVADCIRYVGQLFDAGADEILFLLQMGTVPHEAVMETIRNIGSRVIPHFRAKAAASKTGHPSSQA